MLGYLECFDIRTFGRRDTVSSLTQYPEFGNRGTTVKVIKKQNAIRWTLNYANINCAGVGSFDLIAKLKSFLLEYRPNIIEIILALCRFIFE